MERCKVCGKALIFDPESGEYVCPDGHVSEDRAVDGGKFWVAGDLEESIRRSQVGGPIRLSDPRPLSTMIGGEGEDAWRLRRAQRFVEDDSELRRRERFMELMRDVASRLSLPNGYLEDAARMYMKLERRDAVRGRRLAPLAIALLYYVSRARGLGRSVEEFLEVGSAWGMSRRSLKRSVREYYMSLREIDDGLEEADETRPTRANVMAHIGKLASELGLSPRVEALARDMARQINYDVLMGRNPRGIAIALLSVAGNVLNEDIRQGDLSEVSGISTVTLRKRKREILENFTIEVVPGLA